MLCLCVLVSPPHQTLFCVLASKTKLGLNMSLECPNNCLMMLSFSADTPEVDPRCWSFFTRICALAGRGFLMFILLLLTNHSWGLLYSSDPPTADGLCVELDLHVQDSQFCYCHVGKSGRDLWRNEEETKSMKYLVLRRKLSDEHLLKNQSRFCRSFKVPSDCNFSCENSSALFVFTLSCDDLKSASVWINLTGAS